MRFEAEIAQLSGSSGAGTLAAGAAPVWSGLPGGERASRVQGCAIQAPFTEGASCECSSVRMCVCLCVFVCLWTRHPPTCTCNVHPVV